MRIESLTPHKVSEITESLQGMLGQDIFGLLPVAVGAKSTFELIKWAYGESYPDDEQLERLVLVFEAVAAVQDCQGNSYARHWFVESRCQDGSTVYDAVRVGNCHMVQASANALGADLTV